MQSTGIGYGVYDGTFTLFLAIWQELPDSSTQHLSRSHISFILRLSFLAVNVLRRKRSMVSRMDAPKSLIHNYPAFLQRFSHWRGYYHRLNCYWTSYNCGQWLVAQEPDASAKRRGTQSSPARGPSRLTESCSHSAAHFGLIHTISSPMSYRGASVGKKLVASGKCHMAENAMRG